MVKSSNFKAEGTYTTCWRISSAPLCAREIGTQLVAKHLDIQWLNISKARTRVTPVQLTSPPNSFWPGLIALEGAVYMLRGKGMAKCWPSGKQAETGEQGRRASGSREGEARDLR